MIWLRRWLPMILLLLGFVLLASNVYMGERFPYTHDGENHLVRFVNYAAALREGQWPPRFAPYVFSGYGFPVFVFNYPLANIISVPQLLLKIHPEMVFRIQVVVALLLGAISTWYFFHRSPWKSGAWFATLLYLFSSYLASLLVFRGSIGEIWSYGLVPFAFLSLFLSLQTRQKYWWPIFSLSLTLLLLAHNLFGLMFAAALFLFSIVWLQKERIISLLLAWTTGVGLTLWFWVPALGELNKTILQQDELATRAVDNTLSLAQILFSPLSFGFSRSGPLDSLGFGIGLIFVVLLVLNFAVLIRTLTAIVKRKMDIWQTDSLISLFTGVGAIFLIWMSSSWSIWLWQKLPMLSILQFPWRLLFPLTLVLIFFGGWFYSQNKIIWKYFLLSILIVQIAQHVSLKPADRFHYERDYYVLHASTTLTRNENRPITFQAETLTSWEPRAQITSGEGEITQTQLWNGSERQYSVLTKTHVVVTEPTVYFLGWETTADGQNVILRPELSQGFIAYELSARETPYQIHTQTTESTVWRQVGNTLSIISLGIFVSWVFKIGRDKEV